MKTSRRNFLASTGLAATVAAFPSPRVMGADKGKKKYRTALVGCGWWGGNIMNAALNSGTIDLVAICDVDRRQIDKKLELLKEKNITPETFGDYREMLEKVKPDIVINATPDHWHALITIAACEAGAHVYVEKPISHTIHEGLAMIKVARETDRTVQVGLHRRTAPHHISAMEFLKSGKVGKIGTVKAIICYPSTSGKPVPDAPIPEGLDWDFFCGPAPLVPFNPLMHPKGFRQFLTFSNGQISDWGTHWLDQVNWWRGDVAHPTMVASIGGRHTFEDNSTTPDTQHVVYKFDDFDLVWEHRHYAGNPQEKHNVGLYFFGTNGVLHLGWLDGWNFYPRGDVNGTPTEHGDAVLDLPDHQTIASLWTDFIDAIQTKRRPICDIENGHRATTMALLAMLSLKLGRSIAWDGKNQTIPNDPEACKLLSREYRAPWKYPQI